MGLASYGLTILECDEHKTLDQVVAEWHLYEKSPWDTMPATLKGIDSDTQSGTEEEVTLQVTLVLNFQPLE